MVRRGLKWANRGGTGGVERSPPSYGSDRSLAPIYATNVVSVTLIPPRLMLYRAASAHNPRRYRRLPSSGRRCRDLLQLIQQIDRHRTLRVRRLMGDCAARGFARQIRTAPARPSQRMLAVILQLAGQHSGGARRSSRDRGDQRIADDERCLEGARQSLQPARRIDRVADHRGRQCCARCRHRRPRPAHS
jgi:hypothetical protein